MKIAVISDLHLGVGDLTDQFKHDDYEFIKFLKFLENNFEKIILLGDIYETLMPKIYGKTKESFLKCRQAHKEIVSRFDNKKYIYIHGNHDYVAKFFNIPEEIILKENNQRILFRHGHQYDKLIKTAKFISEVGVWIGGWMVRAGLDSIYKRISAADEGSATQETLAFKSISDTDVDIIVTGHTHIPVKVEYGNKLYINSGTCCNGRFNFVSIDTSLNNYCINYF